MKKFFLGALVSYLFTYSLGATYLLMKGVKKNVWSFRNVTYSIS